MIYIVVVCAILLLTYLEYSDRKRFGEQKNLTDLRSDRNIMKNTTQDLRLEKLENRVKYLEELL